jgi:hypothetical protein
MAKNTTIKKYEPSDNFDFTEELDDFADELEMPYPDEVPIHGAMHHAMEMLHLQTRAAFDLTKLIVEKNAESMSEEAIFSVFQKASKVVAKSLSIEELFET